jgi:hypothetical protein
MSSRPHPALFEATRSALLLPCLAADRIPTRVDAADFCKSKMDRSFWILRELGRELVLVDHGAGLPTSAGSRRESPYAYECFD